jgi:protein-tyrosine phosphatase
MRQVAPCLYIGGLTDAGRPKLLNTREITAVLKLTHSPPETPYPDAVTVADHPLIDGPQDDLEKFREAVDRLITLLERSETVLVHCSAGSSRSGAIAATALARMDGTDIETALARIQDKKPDVEPHPALLEHARRTLG